MEKDVYKRQDITDTHMYIKVINKKLKAEVAVNDIVQAGLVISNSEVGLDVYKRQGPNLQK